MADTPVLTDGTITLRAHTPEDYDGMVEMGSDPETTRWTTVPTPYDQAMARDWATGAVAAGWRDGTMAGWAIEARDGDRARYAGNVDIRFGPPPDIGYALAPWARGRGVMARAVRLATRWAFDEAELPVVHWSTHAGNTASWRVAHTCGFTFQGELPLSIPHRGELRDGWYATLTAGDDPHPRTTWWPVPVLDGARVRLRPHTDADLPRLVEGNSEPSAQFWLPHQDHPYTDASARAFLRKTRLSPALGRAVHWALTDRDDDRWLGTLLLFGLDQPLSPTSGEIGYMAHPDARGRGLVGEAVDLVVAHAFTPVEQGGMGRTRLQIGASAENTASRRVAERAGFTLVATTRMDGLVGHGAEARTTDGVWYDRLVTDPAAPAPPASAPPASTPPSVPPPG